MKTILHMACLVFCFTSCEDIIEVEDISEKDINVLAPLNNTVLDNIAVTFSWEAVNDAETYHIQVATPSFTNAQQIVKDTIVKITQLSTVLSAKNFEWRVRGENSDYTTGYTTQNFTIEE
ncbi:hypothetical protein GCM10022291_13280 [Postechiella marina]|uniref:SusE outer membrane protein domain-containing protein n=1 Tax=Postechiella marina TaxID=943941 RepID=A0ABP8C5X8_9FLAO